MTRKVALVTGGSRGIGRAIARRLASDGFDLALLYQRDEAAASAARDELEAIGAKVHLVAHDLADLDGLDGVVATCLGALGRPVSVLVNNAGHVADGLLMLQSPEVTQRLLDVHLCATMRLCKLLLRGMIAQHDGVIINVISPSVWLGRPGQTAYAAAKGGVLSFTTTLAREVARFGIRANALCPGLVDTDVWRALPADLQASLLSGIPMGRVGRVEEVAAAAALLVRASYMTGAVLAVDGGLT